MFSNGFVQKRMAKEKSPFAYGSLVMAGVCALFFVVTIFSNISYTSGQQEVKTYEELKKFSESSYHIKNILFDNIVDTQTSFIITTTTQHDVVFYGNGMAGAAPLGETNKDKEYYVYLLENEDNIVIYCVDIDKNVDLSVGYAVACNQYQDMSLDIAAMYADFNTNEKPVFVFYYSHNDSLDLIIMLVSMIVFIAAFCFLMFSKVIHKLSKLGKRIRSLGDYDDIVEELNKQVEVPLFTNRNCILCKDYMILFKGLHTDVIPFRNLISVSFDDELDPGKYFDMKIVCSINGSEQTFNTYLYSSEDAQKVMDYIVDYNRKV